MIKAIKLEWLKFKSYTPFRIILGLFVLVYFSIGLSIKTFLDWFLTTLPDNFDLLGSFGLPVFDFVDIWQNLAYITFLFKYILAFVIIISVCLEYSNKTVRQNFIDGLSRKEFLLSKLSLIAALTILSGVLLTTLGLILGLLFSPVKSLPFIVMNFEFVFGSMLEVFCFLSFAMMLAALIRRPGFTIVLFVLYSLCIEPITTKVMEHEYDLQVWYFPVRAINNIVELPFTKYALMETQDYMSVQSVFVVLGWTALFLLATFQLIKTRDV